MAQGIPDHLYKLTKGITIYQTDGGEFLQNLERFMGA